ncbi:MAG: DUF4255 domain-containing protein [Candidatus Kapabacteria bacterium]|nr:DUF4255 domain-containing protein [Candidatus Kapabacteria bacterium]
MISHALIIIVNEMQRHLEDAYGVAAVPVSVAIGNVGEGVAGASGVARDLLVLTVVNVREERALKNLPNAIRNDSTMKVSYENQPFHLNLTILLTATHSSYSAALLMLSRALRFFQSSNVFTQSSVSPLSISANAPTNLRDRLAEFRLIFDLQSPTMEEVNHLWGTLGGKQYPFALFNVRLLDLKFDAPYAEGGVVLTVVQDVVQISEGKP